MNRKEKIAKVKAEKDKDQEVKADNKDQKADNKDQKAENKDVKYKEPEDHSPRN